VSRCSNTLAASAIRCATVEAGLPIALVRARCSRPACSEAKKKADVTEHHQVFGHVGLLANGPPGTAGLPLL
jgi:hypothetical protein